MQLSFFRPVLLRSLLLLVCSSHVLADIEVIGAGLGRTGTMSLQAALQELGYKVLVGVNQK